jgi:hypothetical protein
VSSSATDAVLWLAICAAVDPEDGCKAGRERRFFATPCERNFNDEFQRFFIALSVLQQIDSYKQFATGGKFTCQANAWPSQPIYCREPYEGKL